MPFLPKSGRVTDGMSCRPSGMTTAGHHGKRQPPRSPEWYTGSIMTNSPRNCPESWSQPKIWHWGCAITTTSVIDTNTSGQTRSRRHTARGVTSEQQGLLQNLLTAHGSCLLRFLRNCSTCFRLFVSILFFGLILDSRSLFAAFPSSFPFVSLALLQAETKPAESKKPTIEADWEAKIDLVHLGVANSEQGPSRYLALHVVMTNATSQPIEIPQKGISALINGERHLLKKIPDMVARFAFQHGQSNFNLKTMQPMPKRVVPANGQSSFWIVFANLPVGEKIPEVQVQLVYNDETRTIDINEGQRHLLGLTTERIGPRGCLALMTITGEVTPFGIQSLVDHVEQLIDRNVVRFVVKWDDTAPRPDPLTANWFHQSTLVTNGQRATFEPFPSFPSGLREFHVVRHEQGDDSSEPSSNFRIAGRDNGSKMRIHGTTAEAVTAALKTAYQAISKEELVREIRSGHPHSRAAALAHGGGRLDVSQLQIVFQSAQTGDPEIQKGAFLAL
ncbi:MAG: hypothetical protein FJ267_05875, partial [Planctomycetes bacterium]|nr:hypothetical protein [Planctomycetota bacterium]